MEIANQLYCPNKVCLGLETQQVCVQVIQMHFNQVVPLMTFSDITKIHSVYSVQNWLQRQNNESLTTNFSYNNYYTQGTFGVLVLIPIIFYLIPINSTVRSATEFLPFTKSYLFPAVYIHFALNLFYAEFLTELQNIFFFVICSLTIWTSLS